MLNELLAQSTTGSDSSFGLSQDIRECLSVIVDNACNGKNKAVLAVISTLLYRKVEKPNQDVRLHQASMDGELSGRTLDTKIVTPFFIREHFPHMKSGSGWLTRSLEHPSPFDANYPGMISPSEVKRAFLTAVDEIEAGCSAKSCLLYILRRLSEWRASNAELQLAKPVGKTVTETVALLEEHWSSKKSGVAKLPTLAIFAAYICLLKDVIIYKHCTLLPLLSHTAPDLKTNRIGDVVVVTQVGVPMEAIEVKHRIPVTAQMIEGLVEKYQAQELEYFTY